jgi:FMN-dependent NADH-azoreductase
VPHFDAERLAALMTAPPERSPEQAAAVAFADELIDEVVAADTLIIALPMYNFTIPSLLKSWVDHIARAGVTFKYTDTGPVGLLQGKKAYLVSALGGQHEAGVSDFMRPYLRVIMNFIGISDVEFISAECLNMGDEPREAGLATAREAIQKVALA